MKVAPTACVVFLMFLMIGCSNTNEEEPVGRPALATTGPAPVPNPVTPTGEQVPTPDIATPLPSREAIRINPAPGAVSETIEGMIAPPNRDGYLFHAQAGQEITIKLSSPDGLANFELSGLSDGQPYKRLANEDRGWTGVSSLTQDYRLDVATAGEQSPYLLTVTILPPAGPEGEEVSVDLGAPLIYSPDGQWQVVATITEPEPVTEDESNQFPTGQKYHASLIVSQVNGNRKWTAVDEWRSWGIGYTYPAVLNWPEGGRHLFFSNVPVPDGCIRYVNGGDLWRLDLDTGETSELLPFVGLVLALSPDDSRLAYFGSYGKGMTLREMASGSEQPIILPSFGNAWDLGGLLWSPDGRYLAVSQIISLRNPCDPETETALFVVDIDNLEVKTLIEPGRGPFSLVEWLADDTIRIAGQDGVAWILDIQSGELSPGTTTGTPQG